MHVEVSKGIQIKEFSIEGVYDSLRIDDPHFEHVFGQPTYSYQLMRTLAYVGELGCKSFVLENHYIDQDYLEDHSAYYSRSYSPNRNWCQRISFFSEGHEDLLKGMSNIIDKTSQGKKRHRRINEYKRLCREYSDKYYIGFMVIKPLGGSPVGRTVIRLPCRFLDKKNETTCFKSARYYTSHLFGIELSVFGLGFQQQDVGVSACATTAIWSSLQKIKDHEDFTAMSPAHITKYATQYMLPFGRAMPSEEGLSSGQMCQAIQSVGLSPVLLNLGGESYAYALNYLHMSIKSGWSPILIIQSIERERAHAVAVVGMAMSNGKKIDELVSGSGVFCNSSRITHLFVNDDRLAPYVKCEVRNPDPMKDKGSEFLRLCIPESTKSCVDWIISEIIIPTLPSVRLSLPNLKLMALDMAGYVSNFIFLAKGEKIDVYVSSRITRRSKYLEGLFLTTKHPLEQRHLFNVCHQLSMPRYVAIVRLNCNKYGLFDIVLDSTHTSRHVKTLGIIAHIKKTDDHFKIGYYLSRKYKSELIYPS